MADPPLFSDRICLGLPAGHHMRARRRRRDRRVGVQGLLDSSPSITNERFAGRGRNERRRSSGTRKTTMSPAFGALNMHFINSGRPGLGCPSSMWRAIAFSTAPPTAHRPPSTVDTHSRLARTPACDERNVPRNARARGRLEARSN